MERISARVSRLQALSDPAQRRTVRKAGEAEADEESGETELARSEAGSVGTRTEGSEEEEEEALSSGGSSSEEAPRTAKKARQGSDEEYAPSAGTRK